MAHGRRTKRRTEGLTLIEASVVVCLVGVLLATFLPTFFRAVRTSKISEATEQLSSLHGLTAAYWSARREKPNGRRVENCLPPSAGPTPATASAEAVALDLQAEPAASDNSDAAEGDDTNEASAQTWLALGWSPGVPLRFRYTFTTLSSGCMLQGRAGEELVTFRAEGDLDGDGKHSLFERPATVNENGELVPLGVLHIVDRVE